MSTPYETPARIDDFHGNRAKRDDLRTRWDRLIDNEIRSAATTTNSFYDTRTTDIGSAQRAKVEWTAFPKSIEDRVGVSLADKLRIADERQLSGEQNEYCEWCVEHHRTSGKILRVTFTTETAEYFHQLWAVDPNRVLTLYRLYVNRAAQLADLGVPGGDYNSVNKWNIGSAYLADRGGSMHMMVSINTLPAAVGVVARAAASPRDLPSRGAGDFHADSLIALTVARLIGRKNKRVGFTNPVGIYLQEPEWNRFALPTGAPRDAKAQDFWTVQRGRRDRGQALRAVYQVPSAMGFTVGDILVDGQPITRGSQIARTLKSGTYVTPIDAP